MIRRPLPLLALAATLLAGCSLEPHYERPQPPVAAGWPIGDAYLRQSEAALPTRDYRDVFRDPNLRALIAEALVNNRDLRVAAANIASARALYRVDRSALFPQVDASGGAQFGGSGSRASGTGQSTAFSDRYSVDAGISAFEIDLFGRIRSQARAAQATWFGTEAAARATRLALVGDVAGAYLTHAADSSRMAVARRTEASAARSVAITRARLQGGIAPRTDLRQAETILYTARADIASLTTALAQDANALTLLIGAPVDPARLPQSIEGVDGLVSEVPAGLESTILLRRPDVVEAEFALRAANARIGAARAAFFPSIGLTGLAGLASGALSSLFTGGAFNWSASPSARVSIFDGGANRGNLAYARAQRDAAVARYEQAIQVAFREVADALARRGTIDRELAARRDLVTAAQDRFTLTDRAYRGGIGTFLESLDAQRTLYSAQQGLVSTRLTRADNLVTLYRVIGGDALIAGDPAAGTRLRPPADGAGSPRR